MSRSPDAANPFAPPKANLEAPVVDDAPPLWNPDAAGAWSLLLSPIFGSILVRKNWQAIGDEGKVRAGSWWIGISVLAAVISWAFGLLAFIYIIGWYFAWQRPQSLYIRERWGRDYPRRGWVVPLIAGVLGWIGVTLAILALLYLIVRLFG